MLNKICSMIVNLSVTVLLTVFTTINSCTEFTPERNTLFLDHINQ